MKFFIVALFCIGAAMAQTPAPAGPTAAPGANFRELIESLEKRASALETRVHQVLAEHRAQNNNLLGALDRQAVLVEALALDLKNTVANPTRVSALSIHHIHVIEEDLLHLENRVSEEIAIVETVRTGNGGDRRGENAAQLIARGEQLVKDAQAAVAKFPQAQEVREINSEVIVVQSLIKALQATPAPAAADLVKDEAELARQERTLRQLIEKASGRRPAF